MAASTCIAPGQSLTKCPFSLCRQQPVVVDEDLLVLGGRREVQATLGEMACGFGAGLSDGVLAA